DDKAQPKNSTPSATPAESLKVLKDFKVELLYTVPKDGQGSWVNLCVDPKGRLITSDQNGPLYRITPPALGGPASDTKVEKLDLPLGGAHGLLWAFDSLYVMVNENVGGQPGGGRRAPAGGGQPGGGAGQPSGGGVPRGLHRARSRDGGDTFEKPEFLRPIQG